MIENPQSGLLKKQYFMNDIPYDDLDYCKYGMPYRKRTRLWNNIYHWFAKPLCKRDCNSMDETGKRHKQIAQHTPKETKAEWGDRHRFKRSELYKIPFELIDEIFNIVD